MSQHTTTLSDLGAGDELLDHSGSGNVGFFQSSSDALLCNTGRRVTGKSDEPPDQSGGLRGTRCITNGIPFDMKVSTVVACLAMGIAASTGIFAESRRDADQIKTVRLKFEAFDKHDASAIEAIYAIDATLHSPDYPQLVGNTQIADTYRRLFEAIPDARDNLVSLDNAGDKVYAQFVLTGHLNGAEGKPISVPIMSVYTVRNRHIVADTTYYDRKAP
jgi:ketosteroid isomerase-like protein